MSIQTFVKNDFIIKQGDKSDKFYIVHVGKCAVIQSFDDGENVQDKKVGVSPFLWWMSATPCGFVRSSAQLRKAATLESSV